MKIIALLILFTAQVGCFAIEDTNIVAAGEWSKPVPGFEDKGSGRGAHHPTIRGRWLLYKSPKNHSLAMYLELQDCGEAWGSDIEIYCNMSPGGGCQMELKDAAGKSVPPQPGAFGGGMPGPVWITLPCDSTVRLRISPYATFTYASSNHYFVAGTFTSKPPSEHDHLGLDVWQGTLRLPAMKVVPPKQ